MRHRFGRMRRQGSCVMTDQLNTHVAITVQRNLRKHKRRHDSRATLLHYKLARRPSMYENSNWRQNVMLHALIMQ